ncbi:hypothetical protein F0562_015438 [Nyssa sinensis]|uniref:Phorbol-ester/DAG-type domain-containing protein n=1 Tax=Nyssa sinensis TaxID=561372 RepID=A0A5J4ZJH6_9ASTE|nr:hypothetical protein F0562_015438 [Nyssa sinensis]
MLSCCTTEPQRETQIKDFIHFHPLILCESKTGISCSLCDGSIHGPVYGCTKCDFYLHKSCAELPPEIRHPFHPQHPLTLTPNLQLLHHSSLFFCGACWKNCRAFTFYCKECRFNLGSECALLMPTLKCDSHEHLLTLFKKVEQNHECKVCGEVCSDSILRCVPCGVYFHINCVAVLPQTIQVSCHRHPLVLTDSLVESNSDEFFCDACKEHRKPNESAYHCSECNFTAHVYCAISEMASNLPPRINFEDAEVSPARWTTEQENIFIDIMEEQIISNNKLTTTFARETWKNIKVEFYMRTGMKYNMKQFQCKFNQLRHRYKTFTQLKKIPTGFGWDPVLDTATAPDEVWERYTRAHPEAKMFHRAGCPKYDKLVTIFGVATGEGAHTNIQYISDSDDNTEDIMFCLNPPVLEDIEEGTEQPRNRGRSRDSTASGTRRARSRSRVSEMSNPIRSLPEASFSQQSVGVGFNLGPYTIAKCIQVLESIEGVDMPTYLKAIEKLQDKKWRETFIEMSYHRRMGWLASL